MSILTAFPFLGLLLSIAILPAAAPRFWAARMGWVAAGWCLALLPVLGPLPWLRSGMDAAVGTWLPFVSVIGGLYVIAGGIQVRGGPAGTPLGNVMLLAAGTLLSLVLGGTAASLLILQPMLRGNAHRARKFHLVLFLILLPANTAGTLSPIGNPPLLAGFLRGVPLAWPATHLFGPWLCACLLLLAMFFAIDFWLARAEPNPSRQRFSVRGGINVVLAAAVSVSVLLPIGPRIPSLAAAALSLWITPRSIRRANDFSWHPVTEVAILFLGIFVTLEPVSAQLRLGLDGPFAPLLRLAGDGAGNVRPLAAFWMCGLLSAFLDNAPSYLVFFDLAGIRPEAMNPAQTAALRAISAGATMFGGLTYIGNAPNMMARAVAAHRGVRMPGFFGFMVWAVLAMAPVLAVVSLVFFRG